MTQPQSDPERAFYQLIKDREFRTLMIEWAVTVLRWGGNGTATTLLAGADHESDHEVADLFHRAATEQGIGLPDKEQRAEWCERFLCREVVAGRVAPQAALRELYELWIESGMTTRFRRWCSLDGCIDCLRTEHRAIQPFEKLTLKTVDATIVQEARSVIAKYDSDSTTAVESDQ